ncbi:MAG: hypothetical protein HQK77_03510 [Desulfobacterales bacterium]|nr:hypothetical protein [Desulfobacterales bacterium]
MDTEWKQYQDKSGIKLFLRPISGLSFYECKATTMIDSRIEVLGMVLRNIPAFTLWLPSCKESIIVQQFDENNYITYYIQHAPWPFKNRDAVFRVSTTIDWDLGKVTVSFEAINEPRVRLRDDCVRMSQMKGKWILDYVDREHTEVTFDIMSDPGGNVPAFLANMIIKRYPFTALCNLKEMAKKKIYIKSAAESHESVLIDQYVREGKLKK